MFDYQIFEKEQSKNKLLLEKYFSNLRIIFPAKLSSNLRKRNIILLKSQITLTLSSSNFSKTQKSVKRIIINIRLNPKHTFYNIILVN